MTSGSGMPSIPENSMPIAMPATIPPVNNMVSKKRAEPVTGAPVMPSCSACTRVRPASITIIPEAISLDGCISNGRYACAALSTAAESVAMRPPTAFWKNVGNSRAASSPITMTMASVTAAAIRATPKLEPSSTVTDEASNAQPA